MRTVMYRIKLVSQPTPMKGDDVRKRVTELRPTEFPHVDIKMVGSVHTRTVPNLPDGTFDLTTVEESIRGDDVHSPITGLICVENTHNMAGGKVLPKPWLDELAQLARKYKIPLHMDGARIFNAAVQQNVPVADIVENFDSIQICFSKGLGCPLGAMLIGSKDLIREARRVRKVLGGAMRQAGVIAATCLVALDTMVERLADDHRRTREIAQAIEDLNCNFIKVDINGLHTNILMIHFPTELLTSTQFCTRMTEVTPDESKALGKDSVIVRLSPKSATIVRLTLYWEITDEHVRQVITKIKYIVEEVKEKTAQRN